MRALLILLLLAETLPLGAQARPASYKRLIDPLPSVTDFHMHYYDDGAADATVTCPDDCAGDPPRRPVPAIEALMKNPSVTVPLLIYCLDDGRQTSVQFDGDMGANPMKVPVGYVCLDILMSEFTREPIAENDCSDDGLGACMNDEFYFRPDDYSHCVQGRAFSDRGCSTFRKTGSGSLETVASGKLEKSHLLRSSTKALVGSAVCGRSSRG